MTRQFLLSLFVINQPPVEVVRIESTTDDQLEERHEEEENMTKPEKIEW